MQLIIMAVLAACFGAPPGFRTANAPKGGDESEITNARLDALEADNARLREQLSAKPSAPVEDTGVLTLLAKGAGVDIADVRWRVQAGVDPEQAVQAALSQKQHNESKK